MTKLQNTMITPEKFQKKFINYERRESMVTAYHQNYPNLSKDHIYFLIYDITCVLVSEFLVMIGSPNRLNAEYKKCKNLLNCSLDKDQLASLTSLQRELYFYKSGKASFLWERLSNAQGPMGDLPPIERDKINDYVQVVS
ncbi:MAG: hypothetical protein ACK4PR_08920, partial [Gammaproteobacteria bacterium]